MAQERTVVYDQAMLDAYVPIHSGELKNNNNTDLIPLVDSKEPAGDKAQTLFSFSIDSIFKLINTTVDNNQPIVTRQHYNSALRCAGYFNHSPMNGATFSGRGNQGWGIDTIKIRDVTIDLGATGGDEVWQLDNAAAVGNWTAGALVSRYSRNNLSNTSRNSGTFFAATNALTIDGVQDTWGWCYWAERDLLATGQIRGHFTDMKGNANVYFDYAKQAGQTDTGHAELGTCFYFDNTSDFSTGVEVPPIAVAAGAAVTDVAEIIPVGVTFQRSRRAKQVATLTRCTAA